MGEIRLIAAIDDNRGLARKGRIPWDLPADRKRFRDLTEGQAIVFGSQTYNEMQPMLSTRKAYVVSRTKSVRAGAENVYDLPAFMRANKQNLWIIGGGQIFALALPFATELYLTRVKGDFACDVFFPEFEKDFILREQSELMRGSGTEFYYQRWVATSK